MNGLRRVWIEADGSQEIRIFPGVSDRTLGKDLALTESMGVVEHHTRDGIWAWVPEDWSETHDDGPIFVGICALCRPGWDIYESDRLDDGICSTHQGDD